MSTLDTRVQAWTELSSSTGTTNNTAITTPANKAPTTTDTMTTEADGRYFFQTIGGGTVGQPTMVGILFALQDANNETASAVVWGWTKHGGLWVPTRLCSIALTAGARVGIASADIDNTWFFCDTNTVTDDSSRDGSFHEHTPGTDGIGWVSGDIGGHQLVEVEVTRNGGTAAAARCFYRWL